MIRRFVKKKLLINIRMLELNSGIFYSNFTSLDPKDWYPKSNQWLGSDTLSLFNSNLKTSSIFFKGWRFKTDAIDYSYNNIGMRIPHIKTNEYNITDSYDFSDKIVILGCSHVEGIGIEYEHTIGEYLSKSSGVQVVNWGVGGCGVDAVFHNAMWLASRDKKPLKVVILWPSDVRFNFIDPTTNSIDYVVPPNDFNGFNRFYKKEMLLGEIQELSAIKYKNVLRNVFKDRLYELNLFSGASKFGDAEEELYDERDRLIQSLPSHRELLNNFMARDIVTSTIPKNFKDMSYSELFRRITAHRGKAINELIANMIFEQIKASL